LPHRKQRDMFLHIYWRWDEEERRQMRWWRWVLLFVDSVVKGAITSKIKHAIKLKTSPTRLAQLLQPSLAFCFSLQPMTAYRPVVIGCKLKQNANEGFNSCAIVVQVLQYLFYVLLHVLFYLWSLLNAIALLQKFRITAAGKQVVLS